MRKILILIVLITITAGASAQLKLAANSYVGVGTNNPYEQFQIGSLWTFHNGGTKFIGRNVRYNLVNGVWADRRITSGYASQIRFSEENIILAVYENMEAGKPTNIGTRYLVLHSNGNVGIGALPTTHKLHVNGFIKSAGYKSTFGLEVVSGSLLAGALLRENVEKIETPLSKLNRISAYYYNMQEEIFPGDSIEITPKETQRVIGFLAEEVERAFPELVKPPDSISQYYSVNYTGMIPVLVEAIKEQQIQVENLQTTVTEQEFEMGALLEEFYSMKDYIAELNKRFEECCQSSPEYVLPSYNPPAPNPPDSITSPATNTSSCENTTQTIEKPILFQNVPNPFTMNTEIKFEIPQNATSARLLIHDILGGEIKSYSVVARGAGNIIIQGSELPAGMYLYTLLVDNTVIDIKKMILTK